MQEVTESKDIETILHKNPIGRPNFYNNLEILCSSIHAC